MKRFLHIFVIVLVAAGLLLAGCGNKEKKIKVGSKNFTEQYIVGEIMAQLLEENGFKVSRDFGMSTNVVRSALETNQIDLYAEYTGTAWATFLEQEEPIRDPDTLFSKVRAMDLENNIGWLYKMDLNNTYALACKKDFAKANNLETLEDLARLVRQDPGEVHFAIDFEFYERADGFFAMAEHYGMNIPKESKNVTTMEIGLSYEAVDQGDVDVAMVFATDGQLKKFEMVVLDDNKNFFPVYSLCPTVHTDAFDKYPEIEQILSPLKDVLNEKVIIDLNYQVDALEKEPEQVAKAFLEKNGLIEK